MNNETEDVITILLAVVEDYLDTVDGETCEDATGYTEEQIQEAYDKGEHARHYGRFSDE